MFKISQTEYWILQNLFARLIDLCTKFQRNKVQIPENFFSKMLKARIAYNFLHFNYKSSLYQLFSECLIIRITFTLKVPLKKSYYFVNPNYWGCGNQDPSVLLLGIKNQKSKMYLNEVAHQSSQHHNGRAQGSSTSLADQIVIRVPGIKVWVYAVAASDVARTAVLRYLLCRFRENLYLSHFVL